jgi:hypothetical protein
VVFDNLVGSVRRELRVRNGVAKERKAALFSVLPQQRWYTYSGYDAARGGGILHIRADARLQQAVTWYTVRKLVDPNDPQLAWNDLEIRGRNFETYDNPELTGAMTVRTWEEIGTVDLASATVQGDAVRLGSHWARNQHLRFFTGRSNRDKFVEANLDFLINDTATFPSSLQAIRPTLASIETLDDQHLFLVRDNTILRMQELNFNDMYRQILWYGNYPTDAASHDSIYATFLERLARYDAIDQATFEALYPRVKSFSIYLQN